MALFNRRNQEKVVLPEEVREYYQAERRERTGRAWLLALATLLVTFLIAAGLFFGGRWLYRAIFEGDANKTTTSQTQNADEETSSTATDESVSEDEETNAAEDETDEEAESPAPPAAAGTAQTGTVTGPTELVNTGPGDEL